MLRVRQAISCAIDRDLIIRSLLDGHARPAESLLPAASLGIDQAMFRDSITIPARAARLLDAAGLRRGPDGIRFHLTMKTSSDEDARLLAAVLQQQFAPVGIALDLRSYEFATFLCRRHARRISRCIRCAGSAETSSPTSSAMRFRRHAFHPKAPIAATTPIREARCAAGRCRAESRPVAVAPTTWKRKGSWRDDLPAINLWYRDTVVVHNRRLDARHSHSFGQLTRFLETAEISE